MIPLYKALRAVPGVCPIACCHGHSGVSPFIAFRAQRSFAWKLVKWLDLGLGPGNAALRSWWGLSASFWSQWGDELVWRLDTSYRPNRLFGGITGRRRIDRDLVTLAQAVSGLGCRPSRTNVPNMREPE